MIIWGSMGREIEQSRGQFYCPQCDCLQQYQYIRVASYFTLYFIPLFEIEHHGDYVKCCECNGQFKPEVLQYKPPSQFELLLHSICVDLVGGTPVEMVRTKLLNAGADEEITDKILTAMINENYRACNRCNLTFAENVDRCSMCGSTLTTCNSVAHNTLIKVSPTYLTHNS